MSEEVRKWLETNRVTKLPAGYAEGATVNGSVCAGPQSKGLSGGYGLFRTEKKFQEIRGFEKKKAASKSQKLKERNILKKLRGLATDTQKAFMQKNNIPFHPSIQKRRAYKKISQFKRAERELDRELRAALIRDAS